MSKNPHDRIIKGEPKKQHLSTIPKSCLSLWSRVKFCRKTA